MPADVVIVPYTSRIKSRITDTSWPTQREEALHEKYAPPQKY